MPRGNVRMLVAIVALSLTVAVSGASAQNVGTRAQTSSTPLTEIVSKLGSASWFTRAQGFSSLIELAVPGGLNGRSSDIGRALADLFRRVPSQADRIKLALIDALEKENNERGNQRDEEHSDFLGDLVCAVASLEDARAIDVLVANLDTGEMATSGLAKIGIPAIEAVAARVQHPDSAIRLGATRTLMEMVQSGSVRLSDASAVGKIKAGLLTAAKDSNTFVRISSVAGLTPIPGPDVTAALTELAQRDTASVVDRSTGRTTYPVRDAATRALAERHERTAEGAQRAPSEDGLTNPQSPITKKIAAPILSTRFFL